MHCRHTFFRKTNQKYLKSGYEISLLFEREIIEKCDEIEEKTKLYKETNDEHLFWSDVRNENLYYYLNLCSYGVQKHKPLKEFYQELDKMNEEQLSDSDKSVIMDFLFS